LPTTQVPFWASARNMRRWWRDLTVQEGLLELVPEEEPEPEEAEAYEDDPDAELSSSSPEVDHDLDLDATLYGYEPYDYYGTGSRFDDEVWDDDWFYYRVPRFDDDWLYCSVVNDDCYWLFAQDEAERAALSGEYSTAEPVKDEFYLAPSQPKPGVERHWRRRYQKKGVNHRRDTSDSENRKRRHRNENSPLSVAHVRGLARKPIDDDWDWSEESETQVWAEELVEYSLSTYWGEDNDRSEWEAFLIAQDPGFGKHRLREPKAPDEPDDIDSFNFADPVSSLEAYATLMCSLRGETEPPCAAWFERFDHRDDDPDALITGTTEAYVPALSIC
jgi:hypothetical protein